MPQEHQLDEGKKSSERPLNGSHHSLRFRPGDVESGEAPKPPTEWLPRLIPRNLPFHQSKNVVRVEHKNQALKIFWLLRHDWFHVFLRFPTYLSLLILLTLWTLLIIIFAGLYFAVDRRSPSESCGLGAAGSPINFGGAFAFSLETCTTVGYGLPSGTNAFFDDSCHDLQIVIYFQMIWSMLFNAFLFAFFYSRVARSENRGAQVVASNKALVSIVDGQVLFQFRLYDVDARHPVVEAHVRIYVVKNDHPTPRPIRLLEPNDELNGMLFLSMPTIVSHHIDMYSLLHPQVETPVQQAGLLLRQVDSVTESREEIICPVCGESYNTHETWLKHVQYQKIVETCDGYDETGTHIALTENDLIEPIRSITDLKLLKEYFEREVSEVICVVEGIDPLTSGTFQSLQSYRYADIVWDARGQFEVCVEASRDEIHVDLDRFHGIRPSRLRVLSSYDIFMANRE